MIGKTLSSTNMCFGVIKFGEKRRIKSKNICSDASNENMKILLEDECGCRFECELNEGLVLDDFRQVVTLLYKRDDESYLVIDSNGKVDMNNPVSSEDILFATSFDELDLDTNMFLFDVNQGEVYSVMSPHYVSSYNEALRNYCDALEVIMSINYNDPICI